MSPPQQAQVIEPHATPSQARAYYAGADASGVTLDVPMRNAARVVARYAPPPDNPQYQEQYESRATDAELEIGRYLFNSLGG